MKLAPRASSCLLSRLSTAKGFLFSLLKRGIVFFNIKGHLSISTVLLYHMLCLPFVQMCRLIVCHRTYFFFFFFTRASCLLTNKKIMFLWTDMDVCSLSVNTISLKTADNKIVLLTLVWFCVHVSPCRDLLFSWFLAVPVLHGRWQKCSITPLSDIIT